MPLIPDPAAFQEKLAGLSVLKCEAGETVMTTRTATGGLLILKSGAVEVVKEGETIAKVSAPGAVFGEMAVLLDQPHTAEVRTVQPSEFHVADAPMLLAADPTVALYVAAILARRLDNANLALLEVKRQLKAGTPRSEIGKTVERVEKLLSSSSDASLVYAGYPYDPLAQPQSTP